MSPRGRLVASLVLEMAFSTAAFGEDCDQNGIPDDRDIVPFAFSLDDEVQAIVTPSLRTGSRPATWIWTATSTS